MNLSKNSDPLEKAFLDYTNGNKEIEILVHSNKADTEAVPVSYFYRSFDEMPLLEKKALELCSGDILDIGAGSGSHSLFLQEKGLSITALEIKVGLIEIIKSRGVKNFVCSDIYDYSEKKYDTLVMLMNGIGFAGDFNGLETFFSHARNILKAGGQIILDSSDVLYMYEEEDGSYLVDINESYYGEFEYWFEYDGIKGKPFKWLFVDFSNLSFYAEKAGFDCEMIYEDEHYNYLAKLMLRV